MVVICLSVLAYAVPESSMSLSRITKIKALRTFPEGWAFFTKNPFDVDYIIYKMPDAKGTIKRLTGVSASPSHLFGIDRTARLQNHEISTFVNSIGSKHWINISGKVENNLTYIDTLASVTVVNPSKKTFYQGTYILQTYTPIPWAWASNTDLINYQESKICKINVISR